MVPDDEPIDSDGCISDLSSDEEAREEEFGDDGLRVAAHLGLLDPNTKVLSEAEAKSTQEKIDMKELCIGFSLLAKASKISARGCQKISTVLARNPTMQTLANSISGVKIEGPAKIEGPEGAASTSTSEGYKPLPLVRAGPVTTPKTIKGESGFFCRFCDENFKAWETADSHTRKFHTGEYYSCGCGLYKTPNRAVLRNHKKMCMSRVKQEGKTE